MAKDKKPTEKKETPDLGQNEGEGSRTAARRYSEGVEATVRSGKVDEKADEAKQALEGPEGEELREAEEAGKEPAMRGATEKKPQMGTPMKKTG